MTAQQAQLHVLTNNPYKYEHILSYFFRGDAFSHRQEPLLCPSVVELRGTKFTNEQPDSNNQEHFLYEYNTI